MKRITLSTIDNVFASPMVDVDTAQMKGYELVTELFADSSGFGQDNEPALTVSQSVSQFETEVHELLAKHGTLYSCITREDMFHAYVGFFTKTGKVLAKKVGHATLRIETPTGYKVRYHATDVIEYNSTDITLRNGGYETATTKKRINEYLPSHLYVSQKNFEWYVHDTRNDVVVPFVDGMTIANGNLA